MNLWTNCEKSLHPFFDTVYTSDQSKQSLNQRSAELHKRINHIFQSMGGKDPVRLGFYSNLFPVPPPAARKDTIIMPLLPLLSPKEFPPHLQVKGPDDPRLEDPKFYEELVDWIANIFSLPRDEVTWEDKQAFKLYLRFMQNPEMAKRAFNFILHHEISHILHRHSEVCRTDQNSIFFKLQVALAAIAIWIYEPLGQYIEKMAASMAAKQIEKEADRTAIHFTKDRQGPTYLLQTMREQQRMSRNDPEAPWAVRFLISASGNFVPYVFTHQLESNRIATISEL